MRLMNFTVERLNEDGRASLVAHFFALPLKDRSLRFASARASVVLQLSEVNGRR